VLDRGRERCAIVTFTVASWEPEALKAALRIRGINFALSSREVAQYDFADKGVDWCVRLSPHYYNTEDEVAAVVETVRDLVSVARAG
jgi:selenocysteine lyase/cysteine desulfurase